MSTASSLNKWLPFRLACRLHCLQQGSLDIGNTTENWKNLLTLAIAEANTGGAGAWARWSKGYSNSSTFGTGGPQPVQALQVYPSLVPGFVSPYGTGTGGSDPSGTAITMTAAYADSNQMCGYGSGVDTHYVPGGYAFGSVSPSSPTINGNTLEFIAYFSDTQDVYVVLQGLLEQTAFTQLQFTDNQSNVETYLTASATFQQGSGSFSVWSWPSQRAGENNPFNSGSEYVLTFS